MTRAFHVLPVRAAMSLTREAFAERYCLPRTTIEQWERPPRNGNRRRLAAAARNYLHLIALDPRLIARMLAQNPPPDAP